jgi:hypothetical protein
VLLRPFYPIKLMVVEGQPPTQGIVFIAKPFTPTLFKITGYHADAIKGIISWI